jgi:hypothetical protein
VNPVAGKANLFRAAPLGHTADEEGMSYTMAYPTRNAEPPDIPLPIRSSLFQTVLKHRFQFSSYISKIKGFGLRPDYPVVKLLKIQNKSTAQYNRPLPTMSSYPKASLRGGMATQPRFVKALPSRKVVFNPPIYGSDNQ